MVRALGKPQPYFAWLDLVLYLVWGKVAELWNPKN